MNEEFSWSQRRLEDRTTYEHIESYHGQESALAQVMPFVSRTEPMPPILLTGEPGIGKTRLAKYLASRRGEKFAWIMAPVRDMTQFPFPPGVALIDEIHMMTKAEFLFDLLEARKLSYIGATTQPQKLDPALKSRFIIQIHLRPLSEEALGKIIAETLPEASIEAVELYASASAGNPRQAMRIAETAKVVGVDDVEQTLSTCRITADGITEFQIDYLKRLSGSPIGVSQLSALLFVDESTIRNTERLLIDKGLVDLTASGRKLSKKGQEYVGDIR